MTNMGNNGNFICLCIKKSSNDFKLVLFENGLVCFQKKFVILAEDGVGCWSFWQFDHPLYDFLMKSEINQVFYSILKII